MRYWRQTPLGALFNRLNHLENLIMASLDDLKAEVSGLTDVVTSVVTLLDGLKTQLDEALATGDPAAVQSVIDSLETEKQALADAVTRDTPAAATPTPPADQPPA